MIACSRETLAVTKILLTYSLNKDPSTFVIKERHAWVGTDFYGLKSLTVQ